MPLDLLSLLSQRRLVRRPRRRADAASVSPTPEPEPHDGKPSAMIKISRDIRRPSEQGGEEPGPPLAPAAPPGDDEPAAQSDDVGPGPAPPRNDNAPAP